jgi:sugar phosphate isomerase/epimerase
MEYYLFAKFFGECSKEELMEHCVSADISGPTALIREGYWVSHDAYAKDLPLFIRAAEKAGLQVKYADTGFCMQDLIKDPTPLKIMADNGIEAVRIAYISKTATPSVRELHDYARRLIEGTAAAAEKSGTKAIIQIHGWCYPHNATAAYFLVKDLDPRFIGIKIDPGNNLCQEGYELFDYQIALLREYIGALGAKDACSLRIGDKNSPDKGWRRVFVPAFEGQADFEFIYTKLKEIGFSGPAILMPFYNTDDKLALFENLKKEVAYLKDIERRIDAQ